MLAVSETFGLLLRKELRATRREKQ